VRQPSAAFDRAANRAKAPEGWRSPKPGGISRPDLNWPQKGARGAKNKMPLCLLSFFAAIFAKDFELAVVFLYEEHKSTSQLMKKSILLAASLLALNLTPVFGQPAPILPPKPITPASTPQLQPRSYQPPGSPFSVDPYANANVPTLTKFNLDFPGGTPKELVAAIEKAMGKPINVIIPDEDAATKLPPLKLNEVTFSQLSDTLRVGSTKTEFVWVRNGPGGGPYMQGVDTGYYFKTTDDRPTDNSVWFFHVTKKPETPPQPPVEKICQFYSLSSYLDRGFTVDDITTAIQTGWKMAGEPATPELNYHKETKLLIAFGEPNKLKTIDDVLRTLPQSQYSLPALSQHVKDLQTQVDELTKKVSPRVTPAAAPEEKSGK
jgi:hypothetical protein